MMNELYTKTLCRTQPWPEPVSRTFRHVNDKIYNLMQGKSEFLVTGNLKDWERWDRLPDIKVKTLTVGARHDEMDPGRPEENGRPDTPRRLCLLPQWQPFLHVG